MKLILDTSVWIEYFKGNPAFFDSCQAHIENGEVYTLELIFGELLQGALNTRESDLLNHYYDLLPKISIENLIIKSANISRVEKLHNKGIGLIDSCIITATIDSNMKLWTLDKKILAYLRSDFLYSKGA